MSASANALTLGEIDGATFDSITGATVGAIVETYDFTPSVNGGDGIVHSTVYEGAGLAEGNYVYVYQIELFPAPPASVGAIWGMQWSFSEMPLALDGIGESFYVGDDGGTIGLTLTNWADGELSAVMIPSVSNDEVSHSFGFVSPNAPGITVAQLIDSGALGGTVDVLSNGAAPMPEPSAALIFGIGLLLVRPVMARSRRS